MSADDVIKRWQAERRDAMIRSGARWWRFALGSLIGIGIVLAAHIAWSLIWRRPPEQPIERLLSPAHRTQIEQCFEIGRDLQVVLAKAQENTIRQAGHPYLFEGQRARLALELTECGRKARKP